MEEAAAKKEATLWGGGTIEDEKDKWQLKFGRTKTNQDKATM